MTTNKISLKQIEQTDLAGGCFWGIEDDLRRLPGVVKTEVGYEGGSVPKPTYLLVCSHLTGHAETVRVSFDSHKTDFETIVRAYLKMHDPTQVNRQGPDVGDDYRSAIFYHSDQQKTIAEAVIKELNQSGQFSQPIATQVVPTTKFWPAEEYHQQYLAKQRGQA